MKSTHTNYREQKADIDIDVDIDVNINAGAHTGKKMKRLAAKRARRVSMNLVANANADSDDSDSFPPPKKQQRKSTSKSISKTSSKLKRNRASNPTSTKKDKAVTGRWTEAENILFLVGLKKHGAGKWSVIAKDIPTRNTMQVKTHGQTILKQMRRGDDVFRRLKGKSQDELDTLYTSELTKHSESQSLEHEDDDCSYGDSDSDSDSDSDGNPQPHKNKRNAMTSIMSNTSASHACSDTASDVASSTRSATSSPHVHANANAQESSRVDFDEGRFPFLDGADDDVDIDIIAATTFDSPDRSQSTRIINGRRMDAGLLDRSLSTTSMVTTSTSASASNSASTSTPVHVTAMCTPSPYNEWGEFEGISTDGMTEIGEDPSSYLDDIHALYGFSGYSYFGMNSTGSGSICVKNSHGHGNNAQGHGHDMNNDPAITLFQDTIFQQVSP